MSSVGTRSRDLVLPIAGLAACIFVLYGPRDLGIGCSTGSDGGCPLLEVPTPHILGLPVALWGVIAYAALILSLIGVRSIAAPIASLMLGGMIHLQWIMLGVWRSFCPLCAAVFVLVLLIWIQLTRPWEGPWGRFRRLAILSAGTALFLIVTQIPPPVPELLRRDDLLTYRGALESPLRLDFFNSVDCSHCREQEEEIAALSRMYPDALVVYRDVSMHGTAVEARFVNLVTAIAMTRGRKEYLAVRQEALSPEDGVVPFLERYPLPEISQEMRRRVLRKVRADERSAMRWRVSVTPTLVASFRGRILRRFEGVTSCAELEEQLERYLPSVASQDGRGVAAHRFRTGDPQTAE